jgi:hypothetical protein
MANDFSSAINEIMPLVRDGDKSTPFVISRNKAGSWDIHYPYPADNAGSLLSVRKEHDPYTAKYFGADFGGGSMPYVHDKVLCDRLRCEYYERSDDESLSGADKKRLRALINFFEDNVNSFSHTVTNYLTDLDRPFRALEKMCPFNMATNWPGWTFNEDLAADAVDHIENAVNESLRGYPGRMGEQRANVAGPGKITPETQTADGNWIISSLEIGGVRALLTDNPDSPGGYVVCDYSRDNDLGIEECTYRAAYDNYLDAVFWFNNSVMVQVEALQAERKERRANGVVPYTMTASDCVPNGLAADLTGKLIVIKPDVLAAEYRSCDYQLKIALNGFGCSPDARGTAVFCEDLYTGKTSRFERYDALGVADMAKLPEWATKKIALRESLKESGVFEYGGVHFKPERQFRKGEINKHLAGDSRPGKMDMQYAMRNMGAAFKLSQGYSHSDFYAASKGSAADIFKCVESGKLFVPHENELFEYNAPPIKERVKAPAPPKPAKIAAATEKPNQKPSILGDLDASIKEAAEIAGRKGGANTKKRGDLEVK